MLTEQEFLDGLKRLEAAFITGKPLMNQTIKVYGDSVRYFHTKQWLWVTDQIIKTETAFPKIATLLSYGKRWWKEGKEKAESGAGYCHVCGKECSDPWSEEEVRRKEKV